MKVLKGGGEKRSKTKVTTLPKPPVYFCVESKRAFNKYGKILIAADRLEKQHIPALELMAVSFGQWVIAIKAINAANKKKPLSGYIQKFDTGARNISPEVTLKEKAEKTIFQCLKRFGLDPKSEKDLGDTAQLQLPFTLNDILSDKKSS